MYLEVSGPVHTNGQKTFTRKFACHPLDTRAESRIQPLAFYLETKPYLTVFLNNF
jgi:hypothetical protein